jgi:hypothetical protein
MLTEITMQSFGNWRRVVWQVGTNVERYKRLRIKGRRVITLEVARKGGNERWLQNFNGNICTVEIILEI